MFANIAINLIKTDTKSKYLNLNLSKCRSFISAFYFGLPSELKRTTFPKCNNVTKFLSYFLRKHFKIRCMFPA